jgi:hypothetical protein
MAAGCEAIMYGEQAIVAVAIKGQPDASAPITGTIGIKHRVVAIVPPKGTEDPPELRGETVEVAGRPEPVDFDPSDAVSLLSSFKFNKTSGATGSPFDDTMSIRTALITGRAVRALRTQEEIEAAARAIAAAPRREKAIRLATANLVFDGLATMAAQGDRRAADHLASLAELVSLVPATYPATTYDEPSAAGAPIVRVRGPGAAVAGLHGERPFGAFVAYWAELEGSRAAIAQALARDTVVVEDESGATSTLDAAAVAALRKELHQTEEALAALERAVGGQPAFAAAQQYFIGAAGR